MGHQATHCPQKQARRPAQTPNLCPRCKKGKHWAKDCRSKTDLTGKATSSGLGKLGEGPANSPTLCQKFVAQALKTTRSLYSQVYIIHYMDDILLSMESELCLQQLYNEVSITLQNHGLLVAPDKIQWKAPFNYLGHVMEESKNQTSKNSNFCAISTHAE